MSIKHAKFIPFLGFCDFDFCENDGNCADTKNGVIFYDCCCRLLYTGRNCTIGKSFEPEMFKIKRHYLNF